MTETSGLVGRHADGAVHMDGEFHHHHSHAEGSCHAGNHHLLTVEDLTVSFEGACSSCSSDVLGSERPGSLGALGPVREPSCEVLHGLTLSIHAGEVLAVVGASGSGKTVLADALLGIYEPNARVRGNIWFDGQQVDARSLRALRGKGIGFVPQTVVHLDPLMRVGAQVRGVPQGSTREERRADRERRRRLQQGLFEEYGLGSEVARMYPHELSGGMARRVLLMCALMERPRVLIADEPTPGLDPKLAERAVDDLRSYAKTGAGVMLITHDLSLARRVADRIAVFKDGRIVEETAAAAFDDPLLLRHPFSQGLCRALHELRRPSDSGRTGDGPGDVVLMARGLRYRYPGSGSAICDVSLEVRSGERVALVGPSGVGKSTLCALLAGYLPLDGGEVVMCAQTSVQVNVASQRAVCPASYDAGASRGGIGKRRGLAAGARGDIGVPRRVQLIAQHPETAFDPRLSLRASLCEAGPIEGERSSWLRGLFGVRDEWLTRFPHELSGGELMRCCIVRALMTRPAVLLCDESTAMLDLVTQAELWRHLIEVQEREGFGLLFVSHSRELVARVATRVVEFASLQRSGREDLLGG